MGKLNSTVTIKVERRPCKYQGQQHLFHRWVQESEEVRDGILMYAGAIIEDLDGNVTKVFDVENIIFVNMVSTNLCDSCEHTFPECPADSSNMIFGDGKGNDNVVLCKYHGAKGVL